MEKLLNKALQIVIKDSKKHTHFRVLDDGDTSDVLVGCSCSDKDCDRLQMEMEEIPRENIRFEKLNMSHLRMAAPHITASTTQEELNILNYFEKHGEAPTKEYLKDMQSPTPVIVKSHNIWEFAGCVLLILVIFVVVLVSVLKWQGHIDFNLFQD